MTEGGASGGFKKCLNKSSVFWAHHQITWPLITLVTLDGRIPLRKYSNIFNGSDSALLWCPYVEPLPHYSRQSRQQHLDAVVMKTPQRPREKATVEWEERKNRWSAWERRSILEVMSGLFIKNASAKHFNSINSPFL